jgi:hypothetical protein
MAMNTIHLHRVLLAPPERVYRAFLDAEAMAKWLPPQGITGKVHQLDARVGGSHRMTFTKLSCGTELVIVQEGIPEAIPPEMCYLGWQQSLAQLNSLVEPQIPG